jgi:hypothetical protein
MYRANRTSATFNFRARPWSLVAECARPRAQQCGNAAPDRKYRDPRSVGSCCARGRAHSGPGLLLSTEGLQFQIFQSRLRLLGSDPL